MLLKRYLSLLFSLCVVGLAGCETLGGVDHVELARRALSSLCSAPEDGLMIIFPDHQQRLALHVLCAVIGANPRVAVAEPL